MGPLEFDVWKVIVFKPPNLNDEITAWTRACKNYENTFFYIESRENPNPTHRIYLHDPDVNIKRSFLHRFYAKKYGHIYSFMSAKEARNRIDEFIIHFNKCLSLKAFL